MSKKEKLLQEAIRNPKGIRFDDLVYLLGHNGFEPVRKKQSGSHTSYRHPELTDVITIQPWRNGMAAPYQVRQFLGMMEELGRI